MLDTNDRALLRAKDAWHAATQRDDAFAAAHRERRLARVGVVPRDARGSNRAGWARVISPALAVILALVTGTAMAAATAWLAHRPLVAPSSIPAEAPVPVMPTPQHETSSQKEAPAEPEATPPAPGFEAVPPVIPVQVLPAAVPRPLDPDQLWRAAQAALGRGDRPLAEHHLRALVAAPGVAPQLFDRASLALAEIELAKDETQSGRARLASLARSQDPAVAAEAIFLWARATDSAHDRVDGYSRYLESLPPSPYREQALAEKARALIDAGDKVAARACVAELRASPSLPPVVARSTERLEHDLGP